MSSRAIALLASGISQQSPQRVLTSMPKGLSFLRKSKRRRSFHPAAPRPDRYRAEPASPIRVLRPKIDGGSPASSGPFQCPHFLAQRIFSASNRTAQFIDRFAADHRHQIKGRVMPAELGLEETYRGGQNFVNGHRCALGRPDQCLEHPDGLFLPIFTTKRARQRIAAG